MNNIDMIMIETKAKEFNYDLELVNKNIRRVQSLKCNIKKQKGRSDYSQKLTAILQEEEVLKQVKALIEPKEVSVPTMTENDVKMLDFDQTVKAIKSIQSKKTHTRWLTDTEGDNEEYRRACQVEAWLLKHKAEVKPVEDAYIRKSELQAIIEVLEATPDFSREHTLELLKGLM